MASEAVLNAETGPIYLGKNAEVMEGCLVRGPLALGEGAVLKMGAKIYGATTLGPFCKAGGEINNSVLMGFSNKAHDGFLGNSVVGEWCNLGADTNNSNLKNNYGEISVRTPHGEIETGYIKLGSLIGDHAKTAIGTLLNTATIIGAGSIIGGSVFLTKSVPPNHFVTLKSQDLRYRSADARVVAAKAAALAQATIASIDYQLAANAATGAPEWGLALKDDTGHEVGFVVVSGETGALSFQDWTPRVAAKPGPESEGERAAKAVKRTARKAWNWTDNARKETRNFFRELFR